MPTGLRRPPAKMRLPLPSGLNSTMAARSGGSPELTFDRDPIETYIFVPALLNSTPRVEWPPGGSDAICSGFPFAAVCPARVRKADHSALVADVQPLAVKGQAVWIIETAGECESLLGHAVVIRVAKDGDLPFARLGKDHVAVRREQHRPRIAEFVGEERDVEPGRHVQRRIGGRSADGGRIAGRRRRVRLRQLIDADLVMLQQRIVRGGDASLASAPRRASRRGR